jgi:hypothetical protein
MTVSLARVFELGWKDTPRKLATIVAAITFLASELDAAEDFGVADGTRTHDNRNHNPGLYQLSYSHQRMEILT